MNINYLLRSSASFLFQTANAYQNEVDGHGGAKFSRRKGVPRKYRANKCHRLLDKWRNINI